MVAEEVFAGKSLLDVEDYADYSDDTISVKVEDYMEDLSGRDQRIDDARVFVEQMYAATTSYAPVEIDKPTVREITAEERKTVDEKHGPFTAALAGGFYKDGEILLPPILFPDHALTASGKGSLAHEFGHHLGDRLYQNFVSPCMDEHRLSEDSVRQLASYRFYLKSDFFAERFKDAVGKELDEPIAYDEEKLEEREEREELDYQYAFESFQNHIQGPADNSLEDLFNNLEQEVDNLIEEREED